MSRKFCSKFHRLFGNVKILKIG